MKVKVRKWKGPQQSSPAMDAFILWQIGKMSGSCYERIVLKCGKERWLIRPSWHGEECPSNGKRAGIECRCDNCDHFLVCFPEPGRS